MIPNGMKKRHFKFSIIFIFSSCSDDGILVNDLNSEIAEKGGKPTDGEAAGNNLSFPVIWSDGVEKVLPGAMEQHSLAGDWYGVWGVDPIDPQADLFSCGPYLGNVDACIEAEFRAYVQKDSRNVWQASNWARHFGKTRRFIRVRAFYTTTNPLAEAKST